MYNPVKGIVTSEWSKSRKNPATGEITSHAGIDIAAKTGTKVSAAFSGSVRSARNDSFHGDKRQGYGPKTGNHVIIWNGDGAAQYYGHLDRVYVRAGQRVEKGEIIGTVGNTGMTTGPHLHFETWSNNDLGSHFNPRILFNRYALIPGKNKGAIYHTVKSGDTLSQLATKYGTTVARIVLRNALKSANLIRVGQKLRVK